MAKKSKKTTNVSAVRDPKKKVDWVSIKRDYLATQKITKRELADKHLVNYRKLCSVANKEDWDGLKKEVARRGELQIAEQAENEILQMRKRHSIIGRKVLSEGVKAIERGKKPTKASDALRFVEKGIDIERKAEGLDDKNMRPSVINIIEQQGSVLDRYKVQEAEEVKGDEE